MGKTAEHGQQLLSALTRLTNLALSGKIPEFARPAFFGANLCALKKKDGGVRPIAIGSIYRRLAARIAAKHAATKLAPRFRPVQLGVGVAGGAESAVHAVREYVAHHTTDQHSNRILVKIDVKNAFNTIKRKAVLSEVHAMCPEIFNLALQSYGSRTPLFYGNRIIYSSSGVQQGDPLGPLGFALGINRAARNVTSELNVWYLDDGTLGGSVGEVVEQLASLKAELADVGLDVNPQKCELTFLNPGLPDHYQQVLSSIRSVLPGIRVTSLDELLLLGSPVSDSSIPTSLSAAKSLVSRLCARIGLLDRGVYRSRKRGGRSFHCTSFTPYLSTSKPILYLPILPPSLLSWVV